MLSDSETILLESEWVFFNVRCVPSQNKEIVLYVRHVFLLNYFINLPFSLEWGMFM